MKYKGRQKLGRRLKGEKKAKTNKQKNKKKKSTNKQKQKPKQK